TVLQRSRTSEALGTSAISDHRLFTSSFIRIIHSGVVVKKKIINLSSFFWTYGLLQCGSPTATHCPHWLPWSSAIMRNLGVPETSTDQYCQIPSVLARGMAATVLPLPAS